MTIDSAKLGGRISRPIGLTFLVNLCDRILCMLLGVWLTITGLISIVLPFIPTIATLVASSFFLNRGLPRLQSRLKALPLIGSWIKYLDGTKLMTPQVRRRVVVYLWANLLATCACLIGIGVANILIVSINLLCCVLSTLFVLKFRAHSSKIHQATTGVASDTSSSSLEEVQVLESVHGISHELARSLGGLPRTTEPDPDRSASF